MHPTRIALPVPPLGSAATDAGDAYVASLAVTIAGPAGSIAVTGTEFETFMMAVCRRHLAFHPRTREARGGRMTAYEMANAIGRNWSQIDNFDVWTLGEQIEKICQGHGDCNWEITNAP